MVTDMLPCVEKCSLTELTYFSLATFCLAIMYCNKQITAESLTMSTCYDLQIVQHVTYCDCICPFS